MHQRNVSDWNNKLKMANSTASRVDVNDRDYDFDSFTYLKALDII